MSSILLTPFVLLALSLAFLLADSDEARCHAVRYSMEKPKWQETTLRLWTVAHKELICQPDNSQGTEFCQQSHE